MSNLVVECWAGLELDVRWKIDMESDENLQDRTNESFFNEFCFDF